jgi:hypothetical protein
VQKRSDRHGHLLCARGSAAQSAACGTQDGRLIGRFWT